MNTSEYLTFVLLSTWFLYSCLCRSNLCHKNLDSEGNAAAVSIIEN